MAEDWECFKDDFEIFLVATEDRSWWPGPIRTSLKLYRSSNKSNPKKTVCGGHELGKNFRASGQHDQTEDTANLRTHPI